MKILCSIFIILLTSISIARAEITLTTSCKKNQFSWKLDFKIDESKKTISSLRKFDMSDGRPDGNFIKLEGENRVTFFKNGSVKYFSYELYNSQNQLEKYEFYEMMNKIDMNGQLYAKCSVVSMRKVGSQPQRPNASGSGSSSNSKNSNKKTNRNSEGRSKSKQWQTEWTNSDGSKSQTILDFFNQAKPDGQLGSYGWSNGRFFGLYMNKSARFEGRWVQDKSSQRCDDSINGSFFHGKVWFQVSTKNSFKGKWSYCNETPNFDWRGWID